MLHGPNEEDAAKVWRAHVGKIMNESNERNQIVEADIVDE